jgi:hypothetical protein
MQLSLEMRLNLARVTLMTPDVGVLRRAHADAEALQGEEKVSMYQ